jgi:oligosaccharide repeat unit polymerase
MTFLYELKLINFDPLTTQTYLIILAGFSFFLLGVLTIYSARYASGKSSNVFESDDVFIALFQDDAKLVKLIILTTSIIGFLSAFQHWYVLIREFGSIISAVLQAGKIYRQGVEGEIKGVIPYIFIFSYVGVFFSGLYTAFKNKITLIALLPLLAVILKQIAFVSRAGMLFGFLEFTISFFLFRHLLNKDKKHQKKTSKTKIVFSILLVFVLVYGSASLVKVLRNPVEDYKAASRSIGKFEGGAFISPSIYLYACSHLGVLNQYFINDDEKSSFGRNTFLPVYNILAKFDVVEDQGIYQQGYFIPMWTNTGTYLRELHSDFGYLGLFLIPFILGLISTWLWYKLYETQELIYLLLATFVYLIISFSFLVMITRVSFWLISFLLLLIIFPFVEKYQKQKFSNFTDP